MRITIDTDQNVLSIGENRKLPLYSPEAFQILSKIWLKVGWNARYHYTFTWLGQPILQLPEDLLRVQEFVFEYRPDVILETGVAFGGSLLYYATLCKALGNGRVIGVEIALREPNRNRLMEHSLSNLLTLVDGDSTDGGTVTQLKSLISPQEKVLVILDSNHSRAHVLKELELYHSFIKPGGYIVASDGIKSEMHDVPRGKPHWRWDNPIRAVRTFLKKHADFVLEEPERRYNRSPIRKNVTHLKSAWLKRKEE